ncbi:MAG TPA: hypothetical protein DCX32_01030 [Candidatus Moranbacteria bacterium]|nr:MAG: hypothetical protein UW95_C0016G0008 [Parcubacteria group bacterium GW2011_GWC1_45_14]HAV11116.1 hypothetical protein [Candidatus Moranbacteria bacterium]
MANVKIELDPEKKSAVAEKVATIIKSLMPNTFLEKPIVGFREDQPDRMILIYEGVNNPHEVALLAMTGGASTASIM